MDNVLNCWYYDQEVQPADMKLIATTLIQMCFSANGGNPLAMGLTPTISGNSVSYTKGFVYFGETSNTEYIERTGVNQLVAVIDAGITPLMDANCYLYVRPVITYNHNNTLATVTGEVYTSTNASDEGIQLATIANNVITAVNSINPLGATQLQKGAIALSLLDAYGKLNGNNSWTGDNAFTKVPTVVGLPTQGQGIIASGSNPNGNWIKFADGTIIQRGISYAGNSDTPTEFPISFASTEYIVTAIVTNENDKVVNWFAQIGNRFTPSSFYLYAVIGSGATISAYMFWIAIGK